MGAASGDPKKRPGRDLFEAFRSEPLRTAEFSDVLRGRVGARPDEDLSRLCERLEARREVDAFADGHPLAIALRRTEIDQRLTGLDARANADGSPRLGCPERARRGGSERSFGVVRVRRRRSEQDEDGVADELLDRAAARRNEVAHRAESVVDEPLHALRPDVSCHRGRRDDVDEQTGDEPAFGVGLGHERRYWPCVLSQARRNTMLRDLTRHTSVMKSASAWREG